MKHTVLNRASLVLALTSAAFLAGCDGSSSSDPSGAGNAGGLQLIQFEYGRLVDVYSFRRVDASRSDRRDTYNRTPVLVARDIVIDPNIQTEELFDAVGAENQDADYRFLPFDVGIGHEELLILWDDTDAVEKARFDEALRLAQQNLSEIADSYRNQNTSLRPIPVVPRNAALKLTFDGQLGVSASFFQANPAAVQLLEFQSDPATTAPQLAFRRLPNRVIVVGNTLILDTSLIGKETSPGQTTAGMPPSLDQRTANIRVALPTEGFSSNAFKVASDPVTIQIVVKRIGDQAVIRDFRSGNSRDGQVGALSDIENPGVIANVAVGITEVDVANQILTLNKRFSMTAIRGRVPFVDGGLLSSNLPGGPGQVPTIEPLRAGDLLTQVVITPSGEVIRLRAEILANEDVGTIIGDPSFPALGLTPAGDDGGSASTVRVRVASLIGGYDSQGKPVMFEASTLPLGQDATVRVNYYQHVPYQSGQATVSDADRIPEFIVIDPEPPRLDPMRQPVPPGTEVSPMAAISLRFSEPMDLTVVDSLDNFVLTNRYIFGEDAMMQPPPSSVEDQLQDPKPATLSMLATRLVDQLGDSTLLRLVPPMGFFHEQGQTETYWFHMVVGPGGPVDLAGNTVDLRDRQLSAARTFSAGFQLEQGAPDNFVGNRVYRFSSIDEDGTKAGSEDYFGAAQLRNGVLAGAPTERFSQVADDQTLPTILRYDKGECWDGAAMPPATVPPAGFRQGQLYQCTNVINASLMPPVIFTPPPPPTIFGGILNPHNPRGSRLQMTYREDDFGLSYTDPSTMMLDLEQLHWAPWRPEPAQFDQFDRVTIEVAHADWRPDVHFSLDPGDPMGMPPVPPSCVMDCWPLFGGLRTTFAQNVLEGSQFQTLVRDAVFQADPNSAFQSSSGTTFLPYARFESTYTWRDPRLLTWDMQTNRAVGLGGAKQPDGVFPNRDWTTDVSSPWVPEGEDPMPLSAAPGPMGRTISLPSGFPGSVWTQSDGDFRGDRVRDLNPIAMPLLLDFKVYPDDPANGIARGANKFHIAHIGPCFNLPGGTPPNGYYNGAGEPACANSDWPANRVHTSGGIDGFGLEVFVDPGNTRVATGGWIFDVGSPELGGDPNTGRAQVKPGDGHLHWAQADFVRRVSMATFGFFDTRAPNQHDLDPGSIGTTWSGLGEPRGIPDFDALSSGGAGSFSPTDVVLVVDPPLTRLPGGTSVSIELRGADSFERNEGAGSIYNKTFDDHYVTRGNLLNPNDACEAYRYASPNSGDARNSPRVAASGLTPYVTEENLDQIRDLTGTFLPRFLNMRVIFENNIQTSPPVAPEVRSIAVVYRMTTR